MRLINRAPGVALKAALIALPFVLCFMAYAIGSSILWSDGFSANRILDTTYMQMAADGEL
ncbi:MAG: hypothetical protein AAFX59_16960 [Pseudomonadota bacterium]